MAGVAPRKVLERGGTNDWAPQIRAVLRQCRVLQSCVIWHKMCHKIVSREAQAASLAVTRIEKGDWRADCPPALGWCHLHWADTEQGGR